MSSDQTPAEWLADLADRWERTPFQAITNEGNAGHSFLRHLRAVLAELAEANARAERHHIELRDKRTDLLEIRGILSPNPSAGEGIPAEVCNQLLSERAAPAVEWLLADWRRLAEENERLMAELAAAEKELNWRRGVRPCWRALAHPMHLWLLDHQPVTCLGIAKEPPAAGVGEAGMGQDGARRDPVDGPTAPPASPRSEIES